MNISFKQRVIAILDDTSADDKLSKAYDYSMMILILLNVIAVIISTVASINQKYQFEFETFEIISVIIFTIEYILRIWLCTELKRYGTGVKGRIVYALQPLLIIDLLSVIPFYLPMLISVDLRVLRALRLLRVFRVIKFGRYAESMQRFVLVFCNKFEELVISFFGMMLLLVIASSVLYYFEMDAQPDVFSSIPAAMWWGVAALTTVGYGDVYPITIMGKIFGAVVAILGIGIFALPAGVLASGFTEVIKKRKIKCPYCGREISDE